MPVCFLNLWCVAEAVMQSSRPKSWSRGSSRTKIKVLVLILIERAWPWSCRKSHVHFQDFGGYVFCSHQLLHNATYVQQKPPMIVRRLQAGQNWLDIMTRNVECVYNVTTRLIDVSIQGVRPRRLQNSRTCLNWVTLGMGSDLAVTFGTSQPGI